jgi:hypothetical protein
MKTIIKQFFVDNFGYEEECLAEELYELLMEEVNQMTADSYVDGYNDANDADDAADAIKYSDSEEIIDSYNDGYDDGYSKGVRDTKYENMEEVEETDNDDNEVAGT